MGLPSTSSFKFVEIASSGKRERRSTGDSSGSDSDFSIDLFNSFQRPADFLSSDGALIPMQSADFVGGVLLAENATADAASGTAEPSGVSSRDQTQAPNHPQDKIGQPARKLERSITGDSFAPLNMSFRISSGNWVGDYEAAESVNLSATTMHPSLFTGDPRNVAEPKNISTLPPPVSLIDSCKEHQTPLRSTGHPAALMPTVKNHRISSQDWIMDFKGESASSEPMHPDLFTEFLDNARDASANTKTVQPTALPLQQESPVHFDEEHRISLTPSLSPLLNAVNSSSAVAPAVAQVNSSQSRIAITTPEKKRKKKQRMRQLDETVAVEPAAHDVLCGRGGYTNNQTGNIRFREKALEFRPWYEQSSKEEKQKIADLLVESVTSEGHRFLGKGKDGLWYKVIHGAHRKASQALRERIKRAPRGA